MSESVAHYLWPPRWIDAAPVGVTGPDFNPAELAERVFESEPAPGLSMYACRDGMFVWNCGRWLEDTSPDPVGVDERAEQRTRSVRLINAHLACLHTVSEHTVRMAVVTPKHLLGPDFASSPADAGGDRPVGFQLGLLRIQSQEEGDWRRIRSLPIVSVKSLEGADSLLRKLLQSKRQRVSLFRAESLYRSLAAYQDSDYGAALVHAWTTIEGLLSDRLSDYLAELEDRPEGAEALRAISRERREYLSGRGMSARNSAELLSLVDRLPLELYQSVLKSSKTRGDWLHESQTETSPQAAAADAICTAEEMFVLVEGVRLSMRTGSVERGA